MLLVLRDADDGTRGCEHEGEYHPPNGEPHF
jgi:hypothetical protein